MNVLCTDIDDPAMVKIRAQAGSIFEEAGLSDSYVFKKLDTSSSITTRIAEIIKSGTVVSKDFIEDQYNQIAKTRLSVLADKVLTAYDNEDIVLIYNKSVHLNIAIPFTIMRMGGKLKAVIFVSDYCGLTKDGTSLNIEMKKLYTLMEGSLIGLKYYSNPTVFQRSSTIAKLTAETYAEMSLRILNKEFALSLEKDKHDMINYAIARYYLEKVFGISSAEIVDSYAKGVCKSPDIIAMKLVKEQYDTCNATEGQEVNTIEDLVRFLIKLNPSMERLTFRYYFERWITSYAIGATLAIDNFPYLYYAMISVLLGSFMVNNVALNDLIKNMKGMQHFYGEIRRVIGG